jgi:hypothetical protein
MTCERHSCKQCNPGLGFLAVEVVFMLTLAPWLLSWATGVLHDGPLPIVPDLGFVESIAASLVVGMFKVHKVRVLPR